MTTNRIAGFPTVDGNTPVLGQIINWECQGISLTFAELRDALRESGLGDHHAREMLPRNAFARAARKMTEARIIRRVDETDSHLRFQFTSEVRDGDGFRYDREAVLELDKSTGEITGDHDQLVAQAAAAFDEQIGKRGPGDVTALIKRLFVDRRKADLDLVPMSSYSNFYFVRASRLDFVDQVADLVKRVGGRMLRLDIAAATPESTGGVRDAVEAKMESLISDYQSAVAEFDADTNDRALMAKAEQIKLLRYKVESYAVYLEDRKANLDARLAEATAGLKAKVQEIAKARAAEEGATVCQAS